MSSADKSSLSLIAIREFRGGEDTGQTDVESSDQATSPSLISSSQEQRLRHKIRFYPNFRYRQELAEV